MEIFKSERYFTVFDYFISHGQLLIRSNKSESFEHNIDIIFFDTTYIQLFTMLQGVTIRFAEKKIDNNYISLKKYLEFDNTSLFTLESNEEKFYIAASYFKVFSNNLEFSETSLGMIHKGRENLIAGST